MLSNKILPIIFSALALAFVGCNKGNDDNSFLWGKTNSYEPFLWKKQVPDTLKQTLCFDFNDDAQKFLSSPLTLGVFKKDNDGHLRQVQTDEMQLFVNGQALAGNVITVNSSDKEIEVGVVFNHNAENKMHYWYIKPIDNAGLDRINDQDSFGTDDAIMEVKLKKRHVMNPLAEGLMWLGITILAALVLWFLLLKHMIFPTFRVMYLQLVGPEPYLRKLKIKNCRKCVLAGTPEKQNWFNKVFAGEIKYEVNPLWTAPVVFEPRDKKTIHVRVDKDTYSMDGSRFLKTNVDCIINNNTTKTKTTIRIS
jgi:hypothetical protein